MDTNKFPLLAQYQGPYDLKKMSINELESLAAEVRLFLVDSLDKTGGHLSSNLGMVELTMALLYTYDFTKDKIVFDVGHQSYVYKLLTDRKDKFQNLRQKDGLAGFPKRSESIYDAFDTGHASTSISAALGIKKAMKFNQQEEMKNARVIALIGDGALTGGLSFEGINNIHKDDDILIILNDNQMSISPNVGRVSTHLENLRINESYLKLKPAISKAIKKIPLLGPFLVKIISKFKRKLRHSLARKASYFDCFGLRYYGPVSGHDLPRLIQYFAILKNLRGPRILHAITEKGKGYKPAETDPYKYHGVSPYYLNKNMALDIKKGELTSNDEKTPVENYASYTEAFSDIIVKQAEKIPNLVAITAAMPGGTGLSLFADKYKERFYDVGIAEAHAVTFASGMASQGLRPVLAIYSTFLQRAYDQIIHDCCLQNLPLIFAIDRAGLVGQDGETHQGLYDISYLYPLPHIKIFSPDSYQGMKKVFDHVLNKENGPTAIRYPRGAETKVAKDFLQKLSVSNLSEFTSLYQINDKKGEAKILLIAEGNRTKQALNVMGKLFAENLQIDVCSLECLKPLDEKLLSPLFDKYQYCFTYEEGVKKGGFGEALRFMFLENQDKKEDRKNFINEAVFWHNFAVEYPVVNQGSYTESLEEIKLDPNSIAKQIRQFISKKGH